MGSLVWSMGTSADSFLRMVMGSVRVYSKKSSKALVVVLEPKEETARASISVSSPLNALMSRPLRVAAEALALPYP